MKQTELNLMQFKALQFLQKSHICEEGGAHLRISVWNLLINLKNNYLLKKTVKVGQ